VRTALQPVTVAGEDVNIMLTPIKGSQLGGAITFESGGTRPPTAFTGFQVMAQPLGVAVNLPRTNRPADVDTTGHFTLLDLLPGQYVVHAAAPRGWTMKSVYLDGRDVTDQAIDVKGSDNSTGLNVIFTDRISSVTGAVQGERDAPVAGIRVIAFPSDEKLWRPQTRRIHTVRTDPTGTYRINNLPPGEYLLVATDDVEQGEWFDPAYLESVKQKGVRVTVGEGEQGVQNLKAS
jgi:hypothetical protein